MTADHIARDSITIARWAFQVAIAWSLYRRRLHRDFPFFFAYTISELIQVVVLMPISYLPNEGYPAYFYVGWSFVACSTVLRFAVMYEIFQHLVQRYEAFRVLGRTLMHWSALVLLLFAIVAAAYAPSSDTNTLLREAFALHTSLSVIQCGLFLSLFALAFYFRVSWPHHLFGISMGFALYMCVALAITALRSQLGMMFNPVLVLGDAIGYSCATLVWSYYLLLPEPVPAMPPSLPETDLDKWNRELLRLLQR
jgi:hypothetical protein